MDLMGTELAWVHILQSSSLYRLAEVDSFMLFVLTEKVRRKVSVVSVSAVSVSTGSFLLASSERRWTLLRWVFHITWKMRNAGILH